MKLTSRAMMMLVGCIVVGASSTAIAQPTIVINTREFTVSQPGLATTRILEMNTNSSSTTYYDFRSASSHMGFEEVGKSFLLMHRDARPNQGTISSIVTHGVDESTTGLTQPSASVQMDWTTLPTVVTATLGDDNFTEFNKSGPTTATGRWSLARNTDGGVLSGFPLDQDWSFTINARFNAGMPKWSVYTPNGEVALDQAEPLTVTYKAPPANAGYDLRTQEGTPIEICAQVIGAGPSTYQWSSDGTPAIMQGGTTTDGDEVVCVTHTFDNDGLFTVKLAADDGTGQGVVSVTVQVDNVAPTLDPGGPYVGDEGSPVTLTAQATDPGNDTLQYRWDFDGDGTFDTPFSQSNTTTHTFPQDGSGQLIVEVTDGTDSVQKTASYNINNLPPAINSQPVTSVDAGTQYVYDLDATDPGTMDTLTYSVLSGPNGMTVTPNGNVRWQTTDGDVGQVSVKIEVCDDSGACVEQDFVINVVDVTAPAVAISAPLDGSVTSDDTPTLSGKVDDITATVNVVVFDDQGNAVFTQNLMPDAQGLWSVDSSTLPDGQYKLVVSATDPQNNVSADSSVSFTVDTTAPALVLDTPTNNSSTNDDTPTVSGQGEAGLDVEVVIKNGNGDTVFTGLPTVDAAGNWTVDSSTLPDGTYTVEAATADAAGNTANQGPNTFTVDTAAPVVTLDAPVDGATTRDNKPTASGTGEAGDTITLTVTDNAGNVVETVTATVDAANDWTAPLTMALADGDYTFDVTATDAAGNTATDGPNAVTIDTTAPALAIVTPQVDSTVSNKQPAIEGTADAGAIVDVAIVDENNMVIFTQTVTADANGDWQVQPTSDLADAKYTATAKTSDVAGNVATASTTFTVDSALLLSINAPSNGSIVTTTSPDVIGSTSPNQVVNVTIVDENNMTVASGMATADANGTWTFTPGVMLTDGQYTINADVTDAAGMTTMATSTFTVSTMGPTLTLDTPASDDVTNDDTPTISGTAEAGLPVVVVVKDAAGDEVFTGTATTDPAGNWTLDTTALPEGDYTVEASTMNANGQPSMVGPVSFEVDLTAPALAITNPAQDSVLTTRAVDVTGTSEPNATVLVSIIDSVGNVVESKDVTTDANGDWSADFNGLPNDDYTAQAKATDAAGNTTDDSVDFKVDSTEALIRLITPADGALTNDAKPLASGVSDADSTIVVVILDDQGNVVETLNTTPDANGDWSVAPTQDLTDGSYTYEATATKPNGSTAQDSANVTVDTTPPVLVLDTPTDGQLFSSEDPVVSGTSEPGASILVVIKDAAGDEVFSDTVVADDQGNWSTSVGNLPEGAYDVDATASDVAGNDATQNAGFEIDRTAPVVTIDSPKDTDTLDTDTPTVTGTVDAPGAVVEVYVDGMKVGETTADDQGNWTFDVPTGSGLDTAGEHEIDVRVTDPAGNVGTDLVTVTAQDGKTPVVITSPAGGETVEGPDVVVTGTGEPGDEVTVTIGDKTQTVVIDEDGNWTATVTDVPEGDATIMAKSGDDEVSVMVKVNAPAVENNAYLIQGGGCSAVPSNRGPSPLPLLILGAFGLLRLMRRRI